MLSDSLQNINWILWMVDVIIAVVLVGFGAGITYLRYMGKPSDVKTLCKYFAEIVRIIESLPAVSPVIVEWCNRALRALCTGQPLPEPLPVPVRTDPAGISWIFAGVNKIALISEKAWREGGGIITADGGRDEPSFFSWAYMDRSKTLPYNEYVHYDRQGYYDLEFNIIHSQVINPFDYEYKPE